MDRPKNDITIEDHRSKKLRNWKDDLLGGHNMRWF